ncbi:PREDICTED: TBC1 domain family member 4 isoform X1 [Wasmannia auropunctata]|uniref:TBC1 domain family member 4 isoform X1 n=2 Tax=Wasmannia auropunctata TaxID=64793 RepID=UPI0005EE0B07|nr:PREDICTED: TBC1 domain family member 4 isoform X1 [Wasmannia auropunctata]XP_011687772.1 PREDICTED: TBC1 domain family member 4 isoform X1 [Wasmannia auropunctata]XP_011687773.1 PREDICTED: TBC1 domain family member 4 isoform X1 [Wasmannia auropunctata]XP_011687774.1 PREDICTED: TBC1 domain family member 4 isoform X1 [Wasmannia auropunctata]
MITVPLSASSPYRSYSDGSKVAKEPLVRASEDHSSPNAQIYKGPLKDMKEHSATQRMERDKDLPQRSQSSAASLTSIGADISPSSSQFFEVFYIGKIKISNPKVPESFIDDALIKFRVHGLEKTRSSTSNLLSDCQRLKRQALMSSINRRNSTESTASESGSIENVSGNSIIPSVNPLGIPPVLSGSVETFPRTTVNPENDGRDENRTSESSANSNITVPEIMRNRAASTGSVLSGRRDSAIKGTDDHNRTMVFQVGRFDLRLISPDRKQILLHKQLKDVASCAQGIKNSDHFGFICKESEYFIGYVFKCQSGSVADDLVAAISQAFLTTCDAVRKERYPVFSCEHCPMYWYNKLCQEIEVLGQNDRRVQSIIFSRMELLPEEEQEIVVNKYKGAEAAGNIGASFSSLREQNQFLMRLLRAHCESKQARHVHDTAENRSEFLNQYLNVGVGSTIFMKAKRSLTNSFDNLMKRRGSRDDFGLGPQLRDTNHLNAGLQKNGSQSPDNSRQSSILDISPESSRPRSLRVSPEQQIVNNGPKSSMMDIFLKVGNSPKTSPTETDGNSTIQANSSWRQTILNRVVTPNKDHNATEIEKINILKNSEMSVKRRSKQELRDLWKKAINQQLILIRMEKENAKLRERQEEATVKRIKLEYDELSSCAREVIEVWDLLVSKESRVSTKCDNQMLLHAIKQGVPKGKRGEVWQFLAEQFCLKQPPIDTQEFPNYNTPYELLLKQLTSQQHAILIDLGRTFPSHPYFSSPLGPGQLALFNLLKAYSLLDHEVGYCQGLSFVAGVLLLHMAEDQAFFLLRHLMFRRGLRKLYLPDMAALQLHLYQLSRLLHDRLPTIYNHFDKHEVSPTLYAAPWLLTLFSSQFPLGFVTRVFDLLFLESSEVLFRVSVALLEEHQDQLLCCDSFEEIMEYLKIRVPAIDKQSLDRIMKRVFYPDLEITKQLNEYRVEYQVLQEEMISVKPQIENLEKFKVRNKQLTREVAQLSDQLEITMSNLHRLETARSMQQATIHKFESQNRSLEVTVATLGAFIQQLADTRADIEVPGEVRRIIAQLNMVEKRRNAGTKSYPLKVIEDNKYGIIKSNSTGRESQNLLRNNSMDTPYPLKSTLSQPNLATKLEKVSSFFSNSHNHIQKQRAQLAALRNEYSEQIRGNNDENDPKSVNIDIQITDTMNLANNPIPQDENNLKVPTTNLEKSISLPLKLKLKSSKSAYELGSVKKVPTSKLEITSNDSLTNLTGTIHPLDTCSDVNFRFSGTTKLKSIKPVKSSQSCQEDGSNKQKPDQISDPLNR